MHVLVCVCVSGVGTYVMDEACPQRHSDCCSELSLCVRVQNPEFGTPEATIEAVVKIEELQDEIRHAEVTRTVIEAKMDLLRQGGGECRADTLPSCSGLVAVW